MKRHRWIVIIGATVLGLIAIAVSIFIGGGWALVLLEGAAVGLLVVLFLRGQHEDQDLDRGDE